MIPAKARYRDIALFWKIPESEIESIDNDNREKAQRCLQAAISYWLRHNTDNIPHAPKVNWQSIIDALRDASVGQIEVGKKIEESFKIEIRERIQEHSEA